MSRSSGSQPQSSEHGEADEKLMLGEYRLKASSSASADLGALACEVLLAPPPAQWQCVGE